MVFYSQPLIINQSLCLLSFKKVDMRTMVGGMYFLRVITLATYLILKRIPRSEKRVAWIEWTFQSMLATELVRLRLNHSIDKEK